MNSQTGTARQSRLGDLFTPRNRKTPENSFTLRAQKGSNMASGSDSQRVMVFLILMFCCHGVSTAVNAFVGQCVELCCFGDAEHHHLLFQGCGRNL
ncbi:hypothetical protein AMELA_G00165170 [Ameiurus melas]|uniref:Uncharacterized protein n=1 Tax=Ameiurus melas TaxID=219545 RepID=A0A7J6AG56_AMEME|nr:hypothetical protein AMELA_G00165170 [Ameiurus melas]